MTRRVMWVIAIIIIVVLAGGGWYLIAHYQTANSTSTDTMGSTTSGTTNTTPVATNAVSIKDIAFTPADITVKKGTTVTWTNNDSLTHTVTENDNQTGPNSTDLAPGASYTFTFSQTGTYHYHCSIHSSMIGTVTVTN